ncbi:hypothetical protein [Actinacidiphila glaucinigra]|uniref:Uncharacterized protein n=1 Tax=Actinacidiphila glaucinigra TaxID=235986 RepID=A0A239FDI4_9ACTN|nr:hypothetical protein [Actinacidiphila glaucinigra]SNS54986.1 hypothetical protein SAMN05216252_106446 [Actinacidiphila glaucinigra]
MRIRRFVTWAGVTVTALAAVVGGSGPAAAGGPTSVMLVAPASGKAAGIYASSPDYRELEQSIGNGSKEEPPDSLSDVMDDHHRQVTLTWLIHDVSVWKVDYVYPDGPGGAWVHSRSVMETGLPEQGVWRKAERPEDLRRLLGRLGLMGADKGLGVSAPDYLPGPDDAAAVEETPAAAPEGSTAAPQAAAAGDGGGADGWWLSLPGLGAGLLVGGAGTFLVLRRISGHTPEEGPRQELVDD